MPSRPPQVPVGQAQTFAQRSGGQGPARHYPRQDPAYRESLVAAQHPFACVLGCADSRVPAELLFDQGLGDLFSVRAVGEVLDDAVVGSVEYAVSTCTSRWSSSSGTPSAAR